MKWLRFNEFLGFYSMKKLLKNYRIKLKISIAFLDFFTSSRKIIMIWKFRQKFIHFFQTLLIGNFCLVAHLVNDTVLFYQVKCLLSLGLLRFFLLWIFNYFIFNFLCLLDLFDWLLNYCFMENWGFCCWLKSRCGFELE
jgi:hypothetical protein